MQTITNLDYVKWLCAFLAVCLAVTVYADNNNTDQIGSLENIRARAATGDAAAQQQLGEAYYNGNGVEKDYKQSFDWCMKAALQGNVPAQLNLGWLYIQGQGVQKDDKASFQWYLKAALTGDSNAERIVGNAYVAGIGVEKDEKQGFEWFKKAVDTGDVYAKTQVGESYLFARGVDKDLKKGFTYLLSASVSDPSAAYLIAVCYQKGLFVPVNLVQAYRWCLISLRLGQNSDTQQLLESFKSKLSTEEIERAKRLSETFADFRDGIIQTSDLKINWTDQSDKSIAFIMWQNCILIPIQVEGYTSTKYFLLDTGASISALEPDFAASNNLIGEEYITGQGIDKNIVLTSVSKQFSFTLSNISFEHAKMAILPDTRLASSLGYPIAGILGMDLIRNFVLQIDFQNKYVTLLNSKRFIKDGDGAENIPISLSLGVPFIRGEMMNNGGKSPPSNFEIDTGSNVSIIVTKKFQEENKFLNLKQMSQGGAAGLGGDVLLNRGVCDAFQIGDQKLVNPVFDMTQSAQDKLNYLAAGTIGNEVWRRFNMTFNFPESYILLKQNEAFLEPFLYSSTGMQVLALGDKYDTLTIRQVLPGGAASIGGFEQGDVLLQVSEVKGEKLDMQKLFTIFRKNGTYHFLIKRNNETLPLTLQINGSS